MNVKPLGRWHWTVEFPDLRKAVGERLTSLGEITDLYHHDGVRTELEVELHKPVTYAPREMGCRDICLIADTTLVVYTLLRCRMANRYTEGTKVIRFALDFALFFSAESAARTLTENRVMEGVQALIVTLQKPWRYWSRCSTPDPGNTTILSTLLPSRWRQPPGSSNNKGRGLAPAG